MATTTFHGFSLLPIELRTQIWDMTVGPRTVEIRVVANRDMPKAQHRLISHTSVPGALQACVESRNHLQKHYTRRFAELGAIYPSGLPYVWLNLEIDMVSIGTIRPYAQGIWLDMLKSFATQIKRLKFGRENTCEYWYHSESRALTSFSNIKEIHVVCADGLYGWWGATEDHYWPCGVENLYFIEPQENGGRTMRAKEAEDEMDRIMEAPGEAEPYHTRFVSGTAVPLDHAESCDCSQCDLGKYYAETNHPVWVLGLETRDIAVKKILLQKFGGSVVRQDDESASENMEIDT